MQTKKTDSWRSIRQYRRNLDPTKAITHLYNHQTNQLKVHVQAQGKHYNQYDLSPINNQENDPSLLNKDKQSSDYDEVLIRSNNFNRYTQQSATPLTYRDQLASHMTFSKERPEEDIQSIYEEVEARLQKRFQEELFEKEKENRILKMTLAKKVEGEKEWLRKAAHQNIAEYEELLNTLRLDFQEKLMATEQHYNTKLKDYIHERDQMLEEIEELRIELKQLRQSLYNDDPKLLAGSVEKKRMNDISQTESSQSRRRSGRSVNRLLDKINKYIQENSIESEVSVVNRKELYTQIDEMENVRNDELKLQGEEESNWKLWSIKDMWTKGSGLHTDDNLMSVEDSTKEYDKKTAQRIRDLKIEIPSLDSLNTSVKNLSFY